jgi:Family of unknown function (DUF5995)
MGRFSKGKSDAVPSVLSFSPKHDLGSLNNSFGASPFTNEAHTFSSFLAKTASMNQIDPNRRRAPASAVPVQPQPSSRVVAKTAAPRAPKHSPFSDDAFSTGKGRALKIAAAAGARVARSNPYQAAGAASAAAVTAKPSTAVNGAVFPYPPPAKTSAEALKKLEQMRDYWTKMPAPQKNYGVFPTVYAEMTKTLVGQMNKYRAEGKNAQADAIEAFAAPFANEFFKAFAAEQSKNPANGPAPAGVPATISGPWKRHFDQVKDPNTTMGGLLSSAMGAHILYDLPRVIVDLDKAGVPGWSVSTPADYERNRKNFLDYSDSFGATAAPVSAALEKYYGKSEVTQMANAFNVAGIDDDGTALMVKEMRSTAFDTAYVLRQKELKGDTSFTVADLENKVNAICDKFVPSLNTLIHAVARYDIAKFPKAIWNLGEAFAEVAKLRMMKP